MKFSIRKYEEQEVDKRKKDESNKYFEYILREGNSKMQKENRKLEELILDMERTRDRCESENRKTTEKYIYIS